MIARFAHPEFVHRLHDCSNLNLMSGIDRTSQPKCLKTLRKFMKAYLRAKVSKGCAERDEPNREGGEQVEVESKHNEIECTVDGAMQCAKPNEDPRSGYVHYLYLFCDEKVEYERIEKYRNLEQIF